MSCLAVCHNYIVATKGLYLYFKDNKTSKIIEVPREKNQECDYVCNVVFSPDNNGLALITSTSKQMMVYSLPILEKVTSTVLPRSASRIRFTGNSSHILVADKSGDVLIYNINEGSGTKLLGHLSLLLDVLQTNDGKYVITSDRDEKIRVSCYPNTYNIQTYCLGHKEYVNCLELLPHNDKYLTSASGDGTVKLWDYINGRLCHTIDTFTDVKDEHLKENFIKTMDAEGIEVNNLPIVHYITSQVNGNNSIIIISVHSLNELLVYSIRTVNGGFEHRLECKLPLNRFPAAIQLNNYFLYVYDDVECIIYEYKIVHDGKFTITLNNKFKLFDGLNINVSSDGSKCEFIKILYKRKFDNVQEYQERKKQRLEIQQNKSIIS